MVVLKAMLERGLEKWDEPISSIEVAPFFHQYYMEKEYRKRIDFSDKASKKLWDYNQEKVAKLIERMPMTKWSGSSKGLLQLEGKVFLFHLMWMKKRVVFCLNGQRKFVIIDCRVF